MTALRFFFKVTLRRGAVVEDIVFAREPRRLPVVLSPEEVARLLAAAPDIQYQAALSIAYGAGLRASEVISLKVGDIDSTRMLVRVDQGKGHKDRYVMLSQPLLHLLRRWWLVKRPRVWLFPGQVPGAPSPCGSSTAPYTRPHDAPGSTSASACTPCGIASPRICSSRRPISASFRYCSVTRSSTRRRSTPASPSARSAR